MKLPRVPTPVTFTLIALCTGGILIPDIDWIQPEISTLIHYGAHFTPLTLDGEPWRLVSSLFLHFGFLHLLLNVLALYFLGRAIEPLTGSWFFLALFFVSGIAGNLAGSYWNLFTVSMGASGAIFGLFGFDLILTLTRFRHQSGELFRVLLTGIIYLALIFLVGQLLPFDNAAHAGGLAAGLLTGFLYILPVPFTKVTLPAALVILLLMAWWSLPDYQVIHYRQFHAAMETEEKINSMTGTFSSDAEALDGYRQIRHSFDTLAAMFHDSLGTIPSTLAEDRHVLASTMETRALESAYKVRLLEEQTYRYMDSIELARRRTSLNLNHPLLFETTEENRAQPGAEIVRVWYDEDWRETDNPLKAEYYRLGFKDSLGRWNGPVEDYYLNGGIQMKGIYTSGLRDGVFRYYSRDSTYTSCGLYENELPAGRWETFHENGRLEEVRNYADNSYLVAAWSEDGKQLVNEGEGEVTEYYSNGIIRSYVPYHNGRPDGRAYGNYPDGTIKYEEIWENGLLIRGRSYQGNTVNSYDRSIFYPYPSGGMEAFEAYVKQATATAGLETADVKLLFTCPPSGEIYDIRIWEGHSPRHDRVAREVLKNGPRWMPAREHGLEPYTSEGSVVISFSSEN